MTSVVLACAWSSWLRASVGAVLPFLAGTLWGKQHGAGLVAVLAGPFVLLPSLFAWRMYGIYRTAEAVTDDSEERVAEAFVVRR